jgi:hypothetical protein
MASQEVPELDDQDSDDVIDINLDGVSDKDKCSVNNLTIQNNAININSADLGDDDDYEIDF